MVGPPNPVLYERYILALVYAAATRFARGTGGGALFIKFIRSFINHWLPAYLQLGSQCGMLPCDPYRRGDSGRVHPWT